MTPEQIVENYNKFEALAGKTGAHRQEGLKQFFEHFGERLAMCPASSRTEFHRATPGGLVEHSLRVLKNGMKLMQTFKDSIDFSKEELIFASLFHDIGKLGMPSAERYLPQSSDWHRNKGNVYEINKKMPFLTTSHAGVFLCQHFDIRISYNEFAAILLNDGPVLDENKPYAMKEPLLAIFVHQADRISCEEEKRDENKSV